MPHVFISYSRRDVDFANRLVDDLEAVGLPIWFDQKSIEPGANWDAAIEQGLNESIAIIVIISPDSMTSDNVRNEINFARDNDQRIIPVLYRFAQVFLNLETLNWVDLSSDQLYSKNLIKLLVFLSEEFNLSATIPIINQTATVELTGISGVEIEVAQRHIVTATNTHQIAHTQQHRYLQVLSVITAPFANSSGEGPPEHPLDPTNEWRKLASSITAASQLSGEQGVPIALTRLMPPTIEHLGHELSNSSQQILHLVCYSRDDILYFENEWGHEDLLFPQRLIGYLHDSAIALLILDGEISTSAALLILEESPIQAIISLDAFISNEATNFFARRFYAEMAMGHSVGRAFDESIEALHEGFPEEATYYQLVFKAGQDDLQLDLPSELDRAEQSLIDSGLPLMRGVPINHGFVGQRHPLTELSKEIVSAAFRQIAIYGLGGIGKSWVAAEYVVRQGWRYPDGIVWIRITEQSKSEDVIGQLLALLELPTDTTWAILRELLRERQVLIVLDQADEWGDPLEIGELADFIARLDNIGGTRVLLTSWGPVQPLTFTSGTEENFVNELPADEAERLVWQLVQQYDLNDQFPDQAAVDSFLERTLFIPWLIHEGMRIVRHSSLAAALADLEDLTSDVSDVFEHFINTQFERLSDAARRLLQRLQGLPDGFDRRLVERIGGDDTRDGLRELMRYNVLQREGNLYQIPAIVRKLLRDYAPLSDEDRDKIDEMVIQHLLSSPS
jgi:hypothetical protein